MASKRACELAYDGNLNELKAMLKEDATLQSVTDQVRVHEYYLLDIKGCQLPSPQRFIGILHYRSLQRSNFCFVSSVSN